MKKLILNADDFGPSPFINRGIIKGIEAGMVNSVSVIVTFEEGHEAIRQLKQKIEKDHPHVKIGLHLCITAGKAVYKGKDSANSLCDPDYTDGRFYQFTEIPLNRITPVDAFEEMKSQLYKLKELLGGLQYIDHVNSHQGIMTFHAPFWNGQLQLLAEHNYPIRNPLAAKHKGRLLPPFTKVKWLPIEKYAIGQGVSNFKHPDTIFKLIKGTMEKNLRPKERDAKLAHINMPDYYITQYYGQPSMNNLEKMLEAMEQDDTAELMLHLGDGDSAGEDFWGIDKKYYPKREEELRCIINPKFTELLQQYNVNKGNYPR